MSLCLLLISLKQVRLWEVKAALDCVKRFSSNLLYLMLQMHPVSKINHICPYILRANYAGLNWAEKIIWILLLS